MRKMGDVAGVRPLTVCWPMIGDSKRNIDRHAAGKSFRNLREALQNLNISRERPICGRS